MLSNIVSIRGITAIGPGSGGGDGEEDFLNETTISWTKDSEKDYTKVVMKEGSSPADSTDGIIVYYGPGESTVVHHLDASTTYYFAIFGVDVSYSLGSTTTTTVDSGGFPEGYFIDTTEQYLFNPTVGGNGIEVRRLNDIGTIVATITPDSIGSEISVRASASGNYVGFVTPTHAYVYKFISPTDYTLIYEDTVEGENFRCAHMDYEGEYFYYGGSTGTINIVDIATQTKTSDTTIHSDALRAIATRGNRMITVSNDDTVQDIDRTNRRSMTSSLIADAGVNAESVGLDSEFYWYGSDTTNVVVYSVETDSVVKTITNPTNDITSAEREFDYFSVSSDNASVYIYQVSTNFGLLSTIATGGTYAETTALQHGNLYYVINSATNTLVKRPYLPESNEGLITTISVVT